ncbi:MAG: hypothetical protein ABIN57_00500 [Chitinophagaceae bacterium]
MKQQKFIDHNAFYLLLLLSFCLIGFWPLTFHLFSLKNDALNYFLPVRHQVSEAIYNGYWPLWSPYFNLGYPLHGDMQSGVWNPFVQLFSLAGTYTLRTLQCETLLYVYLSGVGMFYLLRHFEIQKSVCLFGATAFMLCGYNSDSAQFLNWISSASFIPFVFLFYYKMLTEPSWKNGVFCSFFLYLLFATAYPADFIIIGYLMLVLFIRQLFIFKELKNVTRLLLHLKTHLILVGCFIVLSLPAMLSYYEFLPLSERGTGANYSDAMSNPLHPFLLLSYITPLAVWKAPFVSITDPLERNSFLGIITFTVLLFSFFVKTKYPLQRFCKWAIVIFTLFSFGAMGGLRSLAYYTLPLMNAFRHPANAKIFTLFFATLISSFTLSEMKNGAFFKYRKIAFSILIFLITALLIFSYSGTFSMFHIVHLLRQGGGGAFKLILDELSFSDYILINILIQIPFIIVLYFFFFRKVVLTWLVTASMINCVIHTMLFQPFTVVKKDTAHYIQSVINEVSVAGYPLPQANNSVEENSIKNKQYFDEIGAANMYNKKIGRVDYRITPSNLKWQNEFWFNGKVKNLLLQYPLIYAADTAMQISESKYLLANGKRTVLLYDTDLISKINKGSIEPKAYTAAFTQFSPNGWEISLTTNNPSFFTVFQNYYPRWQITIDGTKAPVVRSNISFMGFYVTAGSHTISFQYKAMDLKIAFFISLAATLIIVCFGIYKLIKPGKEIVPFTD